MILPMFFATTHTLIFFADCESAVSFYEILKSGYLLAVDGDHNIGLVFP